MAEIIHGVEKMLAAHAAFDAPLPPHQNTTAGLTANYELEQSREDQFGAQANHFEQMLNACDKEMLKILVLGLVSALAATRTERERHLSLADELRSYFELDDIEIGGDDE